MLTSHLVGRELEQCVLLGLFDTVQARGATLLVRGEAGIGKSSLLGFTKAYAAERGVRVLGTAGAEAESYLPFAGLHRLLRSVLSAAGRLPVLQRHALQAAFGRLEAGTANPYLIALAALTLLSDAATEAPLLLLVEDVQWLDPPTAEVLAFVARRLESDPIVLLMALRDGVACVMAEAGLPELSLERLDEEAANALLEVHAPDLASNVRERLLSEAAGNPLALVELPAALRAAGDIQETLPDWLPLTVRLERAFVARLADLPALTRTLLLVAAADGGDLVSILRAAARMSAQEVALTALDSAVAAGLVTITQSNLSFRHPLVRSAVYQAASFSERQAAHAALAEILAGEPDRRVWHRAFAVVGLDEAVAAELEVAATRALQRGATGVAVAALERAAQLSDDPIAKGRRTLQAAEFAFELGRQSDLVRLTHAAAHLELGPLERPRLAWLREVSEAGAWSGAARVATFVEIAWRMRFAGDTERALATLGLVALRCFWGNPEQATRDLMVTAAEATPAADNDPKLLFVLALADPVARGALVLDRLPDPSHQSGDSLHLLGNAAFAVGALEQAAHLLEAAVADLRSVGHLAMLTQILSSQAWTGVNLGNWNLARRAAAEAGRLARESNRSLWLANAQLAEAMCLAYRGNPEAAEKLIAEAEGVFVSVSAHPLLSLVQLARGAALLSAGRYADAFEQLCRVFDPADIAYHPFVQVWGFADLVEAAVHSNHQDEAKVIVGALEPLALETRSPLLEIALSYARPLLASDDAADALFQAGLQTDLKWWPFYRARLLLAYGVWLRRQRRVADSRAPLYAAREAFDALGAVSWGEGARTELRASGVSSRPRAVGVSDNLSPQELQIAQMAAAGLSNREIGQQLYLSPRTVASHLYRVFPKLGITSRHQLTGSLRS